MVGNPNALEAAVQMDGGVVYELGSNYFEYNRIRGKPSPK